MATIISSSSSSVPGSSRVPADIPTSSDVRFDPEGDIERYNNSPAGILGFQESALTQYQLDFINSPSVNKAIQLFQNCPYPDIWLSRLASIVNSIVTPSDNKDLNVWDAMGNYFGGDKEGAAALNTAYNNLNNLISQFYEWFNKLPVEQRQQFEAAGMNIALDGGSMLSGSDAPASQAQASSSVDASNMSFDNVLNFVTSTAGGLLDLVGLVNNVFALRQQKRTIDISENSTLSSINLQRLSLGLKPINKLSDLGLFSVQESDSMSNFGIKSSNDAEAGSKKSRISLETDVNPLYDAVDDATRLGIGPYNEIMAELGNLKLGQLLYQQIYDNEKLAFDSKQLDIQTQIQGEFGLDLAVGEAQTALQEQSAKQVDFRTSSKLKEFGEQLYDYKKTMLSDWIAKANSGSADSFIYSSLLMKSGVLLNDFMSPGEVGLDYINKGSNILDDLLGIVNPLGWFKALKKGKVKTSKK